MNRRRTNNFWGTRFYGFRLIGITIVMILVLLSSVYISPAKATVDSIYMGGNDTNSDNENQGENVESRALESSDEVEIKTYYVNCPADYDKWEDRGDGSSGNPFQSLDNPGAGLSTGLNKALASNTDISQVLFATGSICTRTLLLQNKNAKSITIGAYNPDDKDANGVPTGIKLESVDEDKRPVLTAADTADISKAGSVFSSAINIIDQSNIIIENLTITAPLLQLEGSQSPAYDPENWDIENVAVSGSSVDVQNSSAVRIIAKTEVVSDITIENTTLKNISCTPLKDQGDIREGRKRGCSANMTAEFPTKEQTDGKTNDGELITNAAINIIDVRDFSLIKAADTSRFVSNIVIRGNTFDNIASYGVRTWARWNTKELLKKRPSSPDENKYTDEEQLRVTNIRGLVVENNTFRNMGGGAIISAHTTGASIIGNTVEGHGLNNRLTSAAIWTYYSDQTLIQGNKVTGGKDTTPECKDWFGKTKSEQTGQSEPKSCNKDGQAFDVDAGSTRTLLENNVSSNNARGFLLLCGDTEQQTDDDGWEERLRIRQVTVRYNVSYNDNGFGIRHGCNGVARDVRIHNNTTILNGVSWTQTDSKGERILLSQAVFTNCYYGNCGYFDLDKADGEGTVQNLFNQFYYANNLVATYGDAKAFTNVRKNDMTGIGGGYVGVNNHSIGQPTVKNMGVMDLPDYILIHFPNVGFPDFFATDAMSEDALVGSGSTPEVTTDGHGSGWLDTGSDAYKLNLDPQDTTPAAKEIYATLVATSVDPEYDWNNSTTPGTRVSNVALDTTVSALSNYDYAYKHPTDIYGNPAYFSYTTNVADQAGSISANVGAANAIKTDLTIISPKNGEVVSERPAFNGAGSTGAIINVQGSSGWNICGSQVTDDKNQPVYLDEERKQPKIAGPVVNQKGLWECQTVIKEPWEYRLTITMTRETPSKIGTGQQETPVQEGSEEIIIKIDKNNTE